MSIDKIFIIEGEKHSIFEGDITRALHYLNGTSSTTVESLYDEIYKSCNAIKNHS